MSLGSRRQTYGSLMEPAIFAAPAQDFEQSLQVFTGGSSRRIEVPKADLCWKGIFKGVLHLRVRASRLLKGSLKSLLKRVLRFWVFSLGLLVLRAVNRLAQDGLLCPNYELCTCLRSQCGERQLYGTLSSRILTSAFNPAPSFLVTNVH